jgi:hypothetical protein
MRVTIKMPENMVDALKEEVMRDHYTPLPKLSMKIKPKKMRIKQMIRHLRWWIEICKWKRMGAGSPATTVKEIYKNAIMFEKMDEEKKNEYK